MTFNRRTFLAACTALAAACTASLAAAQEWPTKPIRILVGFPPGQASDAVVRVYADELARVLGQPVVVDNKPGAGATLAAEMAANAPADGHTLYYGSTGPMAIAPHMNSKLRYHPLRDFEPVAAAAGVPFVLVVSANSPYKTVADLVAAGRGPNGSSINYGSAGSGGTSHLAMELFKTASGTKFTHVPYKGSVQALTDLAGNSIQVSLDTTSAALPLIRSGHLRALAVSSATPFAELPNVPTISSFFPGFEVNAWGMFYVPKGTPAPVIQRLATEVERLNAQQSIKEKLAGQGMVIFSRPYAELKRYNELEFEAWGKAVKASGATLN